jgi:predicted ferric reductase
MMTAAVDEKLAWYVSRSSGLMAWVIITASIVWGLALSSRIVRKRGAPAWLLDLHRYLGTLSLAFTAVHLVSLPFDKYAHISITELLVPYVSAKRNGYAPGPIAWGIVGFYLLIAIQLTSWAKKRIPAKLWHIVHLTSIPLFAIATIHGFTAGTEHANQLVVWGAIVGGLIFFFLFLFRIFSKVGPAPERVSASADVVVNTTSVDPIVAKSAEAKRAERIAALQSR